MLLKDFVKLCQRNNVTLHEGKDFDNIFKSIPEEKYAHLLTSSLQARNKIFKGVYYPTKDIECINLGKFWQFQKINFTQYIDIEIATRFTGIDFFSYYVYEYLMHNYSNYKTYPLEVSGFGIKGIYEFFDNYFHNFTKLKHSEWLWNKPLEYIDRYNFYITIGSEDKEIINSVVNSMDYCYPTEPEKSTISYIFENEDEFDIFKTTFLMNNYYLKKLKKIMAIMGNKLLVLNLAPHPNLEHCGIIQMYKYIPEIGIIDMNDF